MNQTSPSNDSDRIATPLDINSIVMLHCAGDDYQLRVLDECFFVAESEAIVKGYDISQTSAVMNGKLISKWGDTVPVMFRVVGTHQKLARCNFHELTDSAQQRVRSLISKIDMVHKEQVRLLAIREAAKTEASTKQRFVAGSSGGKRERDWPKFALAGLLGMVLVALLMMKSGKDVKLSDAEVQVSNFAVAAPDTGHLMELFVDVGDDVQAGDVLARIASGTQADVLDTIDSELENLASDIKVLESQEEVSSHQLAKENEELQAKLQVAKAELKTADVAVKESEQLLEKLAPLIADENIGALEVQEIESDLASSKRRRADIRSRIKKLNARVHASPSESARSDSPSAKLDRAKRAREVLLRKRDSLAKDSQFINVVAPENGVVQAVHVQKGDTLKASEAAFELDLAEDETAFANGFVSPAHHSKLHFGLPVRLTVPSSKLVLSGKLIEMGDMVDAVTPIPVRIALDPFEGDLPKGEEVEISIKTESALKRWVRGIFGSDEKQPLSETEST